MRSGFQDVFLGFGQPAQVFVFAAVRIHHVNVPNCQLRSDTKAICVPSGDQAGSQSDSLLLVRLMHLIRLRILYINITIAVALKVESDIPSARATKRALRAVH